MDYRFSLGEIISLNMWRNKNKKNKESFCCIDIPFPVLLCWEKIHKNTTEFISFRKLLNDCIPGCGFAVKENAARIEERLRVRCALISGQFKAASGRKRRDLLAGSYKMNNLLKR